MHYANKMLVFCLKRSHMKDFVLEALYLHQCQSEECTHPKLCHLPFILWTLLYSEVKHLVKKCITKQEVLGRLSNLSCKLRLKCLVIHCFFIVHIPRMISGVKRIKPPPKYWPKGRSSLVNMMPTLVNLNIGSC